MRPESSVASQLTNRNYKTVDVHSRSRVSKLGLNSHFAQAGTNSASIKVESAIVNP